MHYKLTRAKLPVHNPCGARTAAYDACAGFLQIMVVSIPLRVRKGAVGTLAGPARAPYGSRRIWRTFEIPVRGPYDARTDTARVRTRPVAWCDHDNNTGVKFLRALHSALRARNRTGVKNRTGPVVGCGNYVKNRKRNEIKTNICNKIMNWKLSKGKKLNLFLPKPLKMFIWREYCVRVVLVIEQHRVICCCTIRCRHKLWPIHRLALKWFRAKRWWNWLLSADHLLPYVWLVDTHSTHSPLVFISVSGIVFFNNIDVHNFSKTKELCKIFVSFHILDRILWPLVVP